MDSKLDKKKRLTIYVFWNKQGCVDQYVLYCLQELKKVSKKLVVTINGCVEDKGLDAIKGITDSVYTRDNKGFDGGAYKETIQKYLKDEDFSKWDEIILCNDTFYGPLYPWDELFSYMEKLPVDFWGISSFFSEKKEISGMFNYQYPYHIQGYFLVFNNTILSSDDFLEFWREMPVPNDYRECITYFEVGLSQFFMDRGYRCTSYLESVTDEYKDCYGIVLYLNEFDNILRKYRFPIIKYKVFNSSLEEERENAIFEYIEQNYGYNRELIIKHQEYLIETGAVNTFSKKKLEEFYFSYNKIFIYGYGKVAHKVEKYFKKRGWKIRGFFVTKIENDDGLVKRFKSSKIDSHTGIIIAMSLDNTKEVLEYIGKKVNMEQLFCLYNVCDNKEIG